MAVYEVSRHGPEINRELLHGHPEVSREVVEETLLLLQENLRDLLLELDVSRWMFSVPDLLQEVCFVHLRLGKMFHFSFGHVTSFVLSFSSRFPMRPSFPTPQGLRSGEAPAAPLGTSRSRAVLGALNMTKPKP